MLKSSADSSNRTFGAINELAGMAANGAAFVGAGDISRGASAYGAIADQHQPDSLLLHGEGLTNTKA